LKVLFPFVGDSVGGSHRSILELYNILNSDDLIVPIFILHQSGPLSNLFDKYNIKYEYIRTKHLAGNSPSVLKITFSILTNCIKISQFIRKNKIDIVHGNDLRINLTWSLPTRLSGSVYLWHQRSLMSSSILWKASTILANHFITISEYVHQSLPRNIQESKKTLVLNPFNTKCLYNGIESRKWVNNLYNISKNTILLGYIGRLVHWKNVDFLIKCFAKYNKKNNLSLHLVIVGTGEKGYITYLKKLVLELGVNKNVTFAGFNDNPSRVISAFDLMIAPSDKEPFGRTLVEAMIQKTLILASKGGGHSEIIDKDVTGRLYSHNNVDDFISQCSICLNDKKSSINIVDKANKIASSKYSSDEHASNIILIYQKLLSN